MATKLRSAPLVDDLGGKALVRSVGLRTDERAGQGQWSTAELVREVAAHAPNRALVARQKEGGYRVEYWRVDGEDGDAVAEKHFGTIEDVKVELATEFAT